MGKRSRKRAAGGETVAEAPGRSSRAARDAARARRAEAVASGEPRARRRPGRTTPDDRPPAPWGSFPLVEIVVLISLVLLVWGFFTGGSRGGTMIVAGLALGSLAGLELSIREHFGGFRSHSTLLAGAVAAVTLPLTYLVVGRSGILPLVLIVVGGAAFVAAFWLFRQAFARKTGGAAFRR